MGSSLSCGCDRQPYFPNSTAIDTSSSNSFTHTIPSNSIPDNTASFRFNAELFQLSADCSQWILLYPKLLSVSIFELSSNRPSILLFASSRSHLIFHQVIDLPREVKRVSPCFAYWRYNNDVFGVNIVRSKDCDRFCELFIRNLTGASMQQHTGQINSSSKAVDYSSSSTSQTITIRDAVIQHSDNDATNCILEVRLRSTSIRVGDTTIPICLNGARIDINPERRCNLCRKPQELKIINFETDLEADLTTHVLQQATTASYQTAVRGNVPKIYEKGESRIKVEEELKSNLEANMVKQKDKERHVRAPFRMQRSFHAQMEDEAYEKDGNAVPSTSWQQPQVIQTSTARAENTERSKPDEIGERFWSGPLRCSNHKSSRRDPVLMPQLTIEKLNNKEERRRSMPNAVLQILHFSDLAKGHLLSNITELVTTEELYVKHLQKLINQYLRPLNLPILELTERLVKVQTSFLSSLLDAAGDTVHKLDVSEQQLRDALIRIFALFVNKCSKFKIYSEYSAAFLRFQQEKKEKWKTVWELERINSGKQQGEGVQSLLIKPIQRVLKYPLFLQQMKDNCTKGCVERQQGEQALQKMQALAEYINEMQRLIEQYGKDIEEIATKHASTSQLRFNQLLMFAHVQWINSSEKGIVSCLAFIFISVVLILSPNYIKNKTKFYRILPISKVVVAEDADEMSESKYYFTVYHKNAQLQMSETFQFCCCQSDVKTQFIKAIRKASTITKNDQRRPLSGSSQSDGGYGSDRYHS